MLPYTRSVLFSPGAVETGVRLLKERVPVFADVSMVAAIMDGGMVRLTGSSAKVYSNTEAVRSLNLN